MPRARRRDEPQVIFIGVVGEAHQRHDLDAGRTDTDLVDERRTVLAEEPLHVRQRGPCGRRRIFAEKRGERAAVRVLEGRELVVLAGQ